jgi:hypothetical protein
LARRVQNPAGFFVFWPGTDRAAQLCSGKGFFWVNKQKSGGKKTFHPIENDF